MEQNCIKTNIYYNEKLCENSAEVPIDIEFSLPDYCPDISKILKCRAVSRISSKNINGNNVVIDGTITINLLYSNEESYIFSYEYQYPFNKSFNYDGEINECNICCKSKCEYVNCRAISGRKLEIHGAASLQCNIIKKNKTEVISDIDNKGIEINRLFLPATLPVGNIDKYLLIEEEIEVGNGQPPIRSILRYDSKCCISEVKIINDKVVVSGEIYLPILYCSDTDSSLQSLKPRIPFSQIIEMPGINDGCKCNTKAEIAFIELKLRNTPSGEATSILANIKVLISCEAICENDIAVISDAYSKKNRLNLSKKDIDINKIIANISETSNLKYDTELTDEVKNIVDLWCDIREVHTKIANNKICIFGDLVVGVIYLNNQDLPMFCERIFDFSYEEEVNQNGCKCDPQIEVSSIGYFLTGASTVEIRIDIKVNAAAYECCSMPLIVDYKVEEKKTCENNCAMLIYYPSVGENIWEIAKQFNSSKEEIKKINSVKEDVISDKQMLLIPIS